MKVSLCITTFNEEKTISKLLASIKNQTLLPHEIIIVDGGSKDETVPIIYRELSNIKLQLIKHNKRIGIAKGRNEAVRKARYPIIAMTDAGCVLEKHWLERITKPFTKSADVVAGFYEMTGKSSFQTALCPFLGVMPQNFNKEAFLPSTRSVAFRKKVWKKVGGFNEKFDRAGEDTEFNLKLLENNILLERVKDAIVFWEVPDNFAASIRKFYYYAKGDTQVGKLTSSHNVHVMGVFLRYLVGGLYVIYALLFGLSLTLIVIFLFIYLLWAFSKTYKYEKSWKVGAWGTIIQIGSDFSVMAGFLTGILSRIWAIQNR